MNERKTNTLSILLVATVLAALVLTYSSLSSPSLPNLPRTLTIGDRWTYRVTYPDGENFLLNETVTGLEESNGTRVYVLLQDDVEHISTQYLWITVDWKEIRTFKPHIGNLDANFTITYSPPIELLQVPLRVDAEWIVNSNVTTLSGINGQLITSLSHLTETREISGIEDVATPAGTFRSFRVVVKVNGSISEVLWFSTLLGQIVSGEYHNDQEVVTQTLASYSEIKANSLAPFIICAAERPWVVRLSKLYLHQRRNSFRVENSL